MRTRRSPRNQEILFAALFPRPEAVSIRVDRPKETCATCWSRRAKPGCPRCEALRVAYARVEAAKGGAS